MLGLRLLVFQSLFITGILLFSATLSKSELIFERSGLGLNTTFDLVSSLSSELTFAPTHENFLAVNGVEGPIQCSKDTPCPDASCCNSDGKCGYKDAHCRPQAPVTCLHNCNATAMCGIDSMGGNKKCGLNLCCSYYGWCGVS
jgi:hypothetical protein